MRKPDLAPTAPQVDSSSHYLDPFARAQLFGQGVTRAGLWDSASSAFVGLAAATMIGAAPQIGRVFPAARPPVSAELSKIDVVNEFRKLTAEWKRHSPFLSIRESCRLPEYERIKKLGFAVVPLILKELEHEPDEWFSALEYLTEENPVADQDRGRLQAVTKAWLAWGRDRGLI